MFLLLILLLSSFCFSVDGQEISVQEQCGTEEIPLSMIFHNIGWNTLHSVTNNYGFNFAGAGLGTWAFIETGFDWEWRNMAYKNTWVSALGIPSVYIGYIIPGITPMAMCITGRLISDEKLQMTALALTQSLLLTIGIQSVFKMTTGRASPGIITRFDHIKNSREDDFSGDFNWFNMNFIAGWPSGHTANAFSAAATIAEIYRDNIFVQAGVYTYAVLMGLGVSVSVHWASEVVAGALIGYAIGKTVGNSYVKMIRNKSRESKFNFYASYNAIGIVLNL
jgi:membrane-associated phospholipid phosphatase